jgi:cation diffusion facilitator family transporter
VSHLFASHSHDHADSVDPALETSHDGIRALKVSLLILAATASAQLVVVLATGSVALLADTVHNFSDALTAVPLWVAFVLARRAPSRRFTYGLGRVEDLAGMFIVAMIAASAAFAGWESAHRLFEPRELDHAGVVLLAGLLGFAGNEVVAGYRIRVGRRIGSAALVADGLHARTDGLTSLAVAAGAVGVLAGFPLADPVVGLLITVMILGVLRSAARDVYRRLVDGIEPDLVDRARTTLIELEGVYAVTEVRMRWLGHRLRAEVTLEVDPHLSVAEADHIADHARLDLEHEIPRLAADQVHVAVRPTQPA